MRQNQALRGLAGIITLSDATSRLVRRDSNMTFLIYQMPSINGARNSLCVSADTVILCGSGSFR